MVAVPRHLACIAAVLFALFVPAAAHATAMAGGYVANGSGCASGASGGRDLSQALYLPCAGSIRVVRANGAIENRIVDRYLVNAIAPSPDGSIVYGVDGAKVSRYLWSAARGTYAYDAAWALPLPPGWAARGWRLCGYGIATDGYGNLYVSNGSWCTNSQPNVVVKYSAAGEFVTSFGDYGLATAPGDKPGRFAVNASIAVTADGSRIWIAESSNQRIQRFDRRGDGYAFAGMWNGEGTAWSGAFGASYGVGLDPWNNVYVSQTTTKQVWRLDPEGRNPVLLASNAGVPDAVLRRPHQIAVDARGGIWVGEWSEVLRRTAANQLPGTYPALPKEDVLAPVLRGITVPDTTMEARVALELDATDDVAVTQMRIADASGEFGDWQEFAASSFVDIGEAIGGRVLSVQVRDAAGRESDVVSARFAKVAPPDSADPTLSVEAPTRSISSQVILTLHAGDDVGVTHVRRAGADGDFGPWMAWRSGTAAMAHLFAAGTGPRTMFLQVRDASWKVSPVVRVAVVIGREPAADVPVGDLEPEAESRVVPARDRKAPRIVSLRVPARSCSRRVVLRLGASDDVTVKYVRIANEDGRYGKWKRYRPRLVHFLSRRAGFKRVTVQVADASGNVSRASTRKLRVVGCVRRR